MLSQYSLRNRSSGKMCVFENGFFYLWKVHAYCYVYPNYSTFRKYCGERLDFEMKNLLFPSIHQCLKAWRIKCIYSPALDFRHVVESAIFYVAGDLPFHLSMEIESEIRGSWTTLRGETAKREEERGKMPIGNSVRGLWKKKEENFFPLRFHFFRFCLLLFRFFSTFYGKGFSGGKKEQNSAVKEW